LKQPLAADDDRERVARDGAGERSVGGDAEVDAPEEGARGPGPAEDAVQRREHGGRRRVDLELGPERGMRDRHHEPGRHPVSRRVAEEDRDSAVGSGTKSYVSPPTVFAMRLKAPISSPGTLGSTFGMRLAWRSRASSARRGS
jgi:hypothetical protein